MCIIPDYRSVNFNITFSLFQLINARLNRLYSVCCMLVLHSYTVHVFSLSLPNPYLLETQIVKWRRVDLLGSLSTNAARYSRTEYTSKVWYGKGSNECLSEQLSCLLQSANFGTFRHATRFVTNFVMAIRIHLMLEEDISETLGVATLKSCSVK